MSTLTEHGELEVFLEIMMSDLTRLHVDLENVIQDIKALNVNSLGDKDYKLFKQNLNKASVEFSEISQVFNAKQASSLVRLVFNAIMGMGEIKLWLERST